MIKKKNNFWEKYFSVLLRGTKEMLHRQENEIDGLLLFGRVAGPAGRRECRF